MDRGVGDELPRHRVFRVIAGRGHGFLPFRPAEAVAGVGAGLLGAGLHIFVGVAVATAVVAVLVAWRRSDGDRSDYMITALNRPGMRPRALSLVTCGGMSTPVGMMRGQMPKPSSPASRLPLLAVDGDGTVTTTYGTSARLFEVCGLDSEHLPSDVLRRAAEMLYAGMRGDLPEGVALHWWVDLHEDYADVWARCPPIEGTDPILEHQRACRLAFLRRSDLRRVRVILAVGFASEGRGARWNWGAPPRAPRAQLAPATKAVTALLLRADVRVRALPKREVLNLYWRALNPTRQPGFEPSSEPLPLRRTLREQLFGSRVVYTDEWLKLGQQYHQVLMLSGLPEATHFTLMEAFLQMGFPFQLSVHQHVPPQGSIQSGFATARRVAHADAHRNEHVEDAGRLSRVAETNALAALLADTQQPLVRTGMQVVVPGRNPEEVAERTETLQDYLKRFGFSFLLEDGRHDREFFKSLPGLGPGFDRWKLVTGDNAVDLMPVFGACHGDVDPVVLLKTSRKSLFSFNPVEPRRANWNAAVFGASGSGKSVFMNLLITSAMLSNTTAGRLMVVDFAGEKKSSYLMVARLFGGAFVPVLSDDAALNPFPPPAAALDADGRLKGETLNFLLVLLDLLLSNAEGGMDAQLYRALLQRAVQTIYEGREGNDAPGFEDLARALADLNDEAEVDRRRLTDLRRLVNAFLERPDAARFLRRPSADAAPARFTIYDLFGIDDLAPEFREAVVFMTAYRVKAHAFDPDYDGVTYVVLDEVAQLLRRPAMVALMHELYSTARKHGTSVWTVTQRYEDYRQAAVAGTVRTNSTTQVFLNHASDAVARREIAEDFRFNAREQALFEGLHTEKGQYSEALVRTEVFDTHRRRIQPVSAKLRIELSPFDYQVATSDPLDRRRQAQLFADNPGVAPVRLLNLLAYGQTEGPKVYP